MRLPPKSIIRPCEECSLAAVDCRRPIIRAEDARGRRARGNNDGGSDDTGEGIEVSSDPSLAKNISVACPKYGRYNANRLYTSRVVVQLVDCVRDRRMTLHVQVQ